MLDVLGSAIGYIRLSGFMGLKEGKIFREFFGASIFYLQRGIFNFFSR